MCVCMCVWGGGGEGGVGVSKYYTDREMSVGC